jgi:pseudaminic acid biosynthesis-associated methylase
MITEQIKFWSGDFGKAYTDRNTLSLPQMEAAYKERFGLTRSELNQTFLSGLDRNARILEVGCNVGMQLRVLQEMGFKNLVGIELQPYAVELAKSTSSGISVLQGSAMELPFRDNWFDLVFTNGVLIHIEPAHLPAVMKEMARCSRRLIWGFEYHAKETTAVDYRGHAGFLWKADFASLFLNHVSNLRLLQQELYPYQTEAEAGNTDVMYLLEKIN